MPLRLASPGKRSFPPVGQRVLRVTWTHATGPTTIDPEMAEEAESQDLLTLGVEEEYVLVDAVEPHAVEAVEEVYAQVPEELRGSVQHEYMRSQIEVAGPPQLELSGLYESMSRLRTEMADAAERAGVRLIAVGAAPAAGPPTRVVDKPRYHRMREHFGDLSPGGGMSGMHVHVSIPDPETGVQVLNHLRPWLPIFQAATANSPIFAGQDTGYASWRSMLWERWPTVGPTPYLESHEQYETLVSDLVASGAMLDEGMLYWYARLSAPFRAKITPPLEPGETLVIRGRVCGARDAASADRGGARHLASQRRGPSRQRRLRRPASAGRVCEPGRPTTDESGYYEYETVKPGRQTRSAMASGGRPTSTIWFRPQATASWSPQLLLPWRPLERQRPLH